MLGRPNLPNGWALHGVDHTPRLEHMSERLPDPSRLELLRFVLRVQEQQLQQTERWITAEEQRAALEAEKRPPQPPPDWILERGIGQGRPPVYVHTAVCYKPSLRMKALTRAQALEALDAGVDPCPLCHPDADLGVL